MDLQPFEPALAEQVATWTTSADEVHAWSWRFDDNVPPERQPTAYTWMRMP